MLGRCACLPTLKRAHESYLLVLHSAMPNSCEEGLFSSMWLLQIGRFSQACLSWTLLHEQNDKILALSCTFGGCPYGRVTPADSEVNRSLAWVESAGSGNNAVHRVRKQPTNYQSR